MAGLSVVSDIAFFGHDALNHDGTFFAGIKGQLTERFFDRAPDDLCADLLIALELKAVERDRSTQECHAAARDNAFFHGRAGRVQSVFHAGFLFFHLRFGRGTDMNDRHTACEFCEAFLEFFFVIIRIRIFDLFLDLADPAGDIRALAGAFDDRGLILIHGHAFRAAEVL